MSGLPNWMTSRKRQRSQSCSPVDIATSSASETCRKSGEVVLGQGFLEVVDATVVFESAALLDGGADRVAVVGVEAEVDIVRQKVPDQLEHLEVFCWVGVLAVGSPVHADLVRLVSLFPTVLDVVQHLVGRLDPSETDAPVERNVETGGSAHQCVARHASVFAEDVPESDVDGSNYMRWELGDALFVA